jgi:hypothetical protein
MKAAISHTRFKRPDRLPNGNVRGLVVFEWVRFERDEDGWTFRLFSFLSHITDNLEWVAYTAVINIGWHGKFEFSFVPGLTPLILIGNGE